jgi:hypothetical protein
MSVNDVMNAAIRRAAGRQVAPATGEPDRLQHLEQHAPNAAMNDAIRAATGRGPAPVATTEQPGEHVGMPPGANREVPQEPLDPMRLAINEHNAMRTLAGQQAASLERSRLTHIKEA